MRTANINQPGGLEIRSLVIVIGFLLAAWASKARAMPAVAVQCNARIAASAEARVPVGNSASQPRTIHFTLTSKVGRPFRRLRVEIQDELGQFPIPEGDSDVDPFPYVHGNSIYYELLMVLAHFLQGGRDEVRRQILVDIDTLRTEPHLQEVPRRLQSDDMPDVVIHWASRFTADPNLEWVGIITQAMFQELRHLEHYNVKWAEDMQRFVAMVREKDKSSGLNEFKDVNYNVLAKRIAKILMLRTTWVRMFTLYEDIRDLPGVIKHPLFERARQKPTDAERLEALHEEFDIFYAFPPYNLNPRLIDSVWKDAYLPDGMDSSLTLPGLLPH